MIDLLSHSELLKIIAILQQSGIINDITETILDGGGVYWRRIENGIVIEIVNREGVKVIEIKAQKYV